jgi:hypothetical protein
MAFVAGPASGLEGSLSFERGAQPGAVLVDRFPAELAVRPTLAPGADHRGDRFATVHAGKGLGPEGKRLVASWVSGGEGVLWSTDEWLALVERIPLQPGPLTQLAVLLPLCLALLGRQRRFHQRVVSTALPWHVPAHRGLLASSPR